MTTPESIDDLLRQANVLLRSGPLPQAIAVHQQLLAARPDLADSWYNLAWLQRRAGQFEAALDSYARALERGIADPEEAHLNRAKILSEDLGRTDDAEAELGAALARNPAYVPALLNLGSLHEERGRRAEACATYERALAADPVNALAMTRLAGVTSPKDADDPVIGRVRAALARRGADAADRADLGFALGRLLDAAGAYDEAFAAYADANAASRASTGRASYDSEAHEQLVDRLISAFPAPAPPIASSERAPVFICGLFRSGSTLVEQILGSHSEVDPGGELPFLPALVRKRLQPYPEAAASVGSETIAKLRSDYLSALSKRHPSERIVTDKRPDNFLHIGLIKTLFPDARIIHTRRDPLDNGLSLYFLHLHHSMAYALDLQDIAHWQGQYRRLMAHWKSLYPNDIHDVDYEALVTEPRPTIERMLEFLGLSWEESVLSFHETANMVKTASIWQVRQPLYSHAIGRWRNYEQHLGAFRAALGR